MVVILSMEVDVVVDVRVTSDVFRLVEVVVDVAMVVRVTVEVASDAVCVRVRVDVW
jgi:hypothetical protein